MGLTQPSELTDLIKLVGKLGASKRWGLEYHSPLLEIKRVERLGASSWHMVYDKPDTLTEEDLLVCLEGDKLAAYYTGEKPLAVVDVPSPLLGWLNKRSTGRGKCTFELPSCPVGKKLYRECYKTGKAIAEAVTSGVEVEDLYEVWCQAICQFREHLKVCNGS